MTGCLQANYFEIDSANIYGPLYLTVCQTHRVIGECEKFKFFSEKWGGGFSRLKSRKVPGLNYKC